MRLRRNTFAAARWSEVAARHQDGWTREQNRLTGGSLKTQIPPRDKRRANRAPHDSAVGTKGAQS